jgi:SAM-dependent methyltransferase
MPTGSPVTRDAAQAFYEDFSLAVGVRDWLVPNPRHERLKRLIDGVLAGRRGLRILDVGCGAGVMTYHLRRYGEVIGIDFSGPAIAAARRFTATRVGAWPTFIAGSLEVLPASARFDVITLFDVLEHIQQSERPAFLSSLRERLVGGGLVFASTPHPAYTRQRRERGDDTLQVVDEEVEMAALLEEAAACGLQLLEFRAYDVFTGTPEFQAMLFTTTGTPGGAPQLTDPRVARRMRVLRSRTGRRARKLAHGARLLAAGERATAGKMLRGRPPHVRS